MRVSAPSVALLLSSALVLAGCLGLGDEDAQDDGLDPLQRPAPQVSDSTGAIEGVVTDSAVAPVAGATVEVLELERAVATVTDGSYVINDIGPGTYTVTVTQAGFVPASTVVEVVAGEVAAADFVLVHLLSDAPYRQLRELAGFMACGFALGYNVTGAAPPPPAPVPDLRESLIISWTICEDVDFQAGNSTADQTYWTLDFDPPLHSLVYEVVWESSGNPLADQWFGWGGLGRTGDPVDRWLYDVIQVTGPSPLLARLDRDQLQAIQDNFTAECEGGDDAFCGHNFFDEGWDFATAVLPYWHGCVSEQASLCAVAQQTFTLYLSEFYNAPAPAGWSLAAGSA